MPAPYLEDLTIRLATGMAALPEETRRRHAHFLLGAQRADGGFGGREGGSDLYYTGFALRGLSILGELYGEPAERAAAYLRQRMHRQETIIDFLSLVYGGALLELSAGIDIYEATAAVDWRDTVAASLERLRCDDGGYAKGPEGRAGSTYHSFLVLICLELIDRPLPAPERMVAFIQSQQREQGGFLEIRAQKRAGTNPTAAAIGVLRILNALDEETTERTIDFLLDMQNDDGGLCANTRIPFSDVLSTFTGLLTLVDLGGEEELDQRRLRRYLTQMESSEGGFYGLELDDQRDVEYTFYGLGSLALASEATESPPTT